MFGGGMKGINYESVGECRTRVGWKVYRLIISTNKTA